MQYKILRYAYSFGTNLFHQQYYHTTCYPLISITSDMHDIAHTSNPLNKNKNLFIIFCEYAYYENRPQPSNTSLRKIYCSLSLFVFLPAIFYLYKKYMTSEYSECPNVCFSAFIHDVIIAYFQINKNLNHGIVLHILFILFFLPAHATKHTWLRSRHIHLQVFLVCM